MTAPTSFTLEVPAGREAERRYVAGVLLRELVGVECETRVGSSDAWVLRCPGAAGELRIADGFLALPAPLWLGRASVPATPSSWEVPSRLHREGARPELPMVVVARTSTEALDIVADLFGTAFFLLTRYEEVAAPVPEAFGRHHPLGTMAGRGGWLDQPVVNEIAEVLWMAIRTKWPAAIRRRREFRLLVTHDVDHPRCVAGKPAWRLAAGAVQAGLRRGWGAGVRRLEEWHAVRRDGPAADPCWTFRWLLDQSEQRGLRSAFYFIPGAAGGSEYSLDDPEFVGLMREIVRRGHEVGFHPSHAAAESADAFAAELADLRTAIARAGGEPDHMGGRHHFLRWYAGRSWEQWDAAGLRYDSSVGFAGAPGFRAGVCTEYPTFDLRRGRALALRERPLVVMDVSLTGPEYLALDYPAAVDRAIGLGRTCRLFGGDFTLLWHNNYLRSPVEREAYLAIVDGVGQA